jgi:hypothetical protein
MKLVNPQNLPILQWTMVWINGSNFISLDAAVHDPIPVGTTYVTGSVNCSADGSITTTTTCDYEPPSVTYPLGRIIWEGTIGPDFGKTTADEAENELIITFNVLVNAGVTSVENEATIDADLDDDGTIETSEQRLARADAAWQETVIPKVIPATGFAPDRITTLPAQTSIYSAQGNLRLEIP